MHARNCNLITLALVAALASPAVLAQAEGAKAATTPPVGTSAGTTGAVTGVPVKSTVSVAGVPVGTGPVETGAEAGANAGNGNWWTDADADADGKLSASEATANAGVNARFALIDRDKDGFVTQEEYRNFFTENANQGGAHAAARSMAVTRDTWLKLDGNSDSRISIAEASSNAGVSGAFMTIDANKDGFVTQDEYRAYARTP